MTVLHVVFGTVALVVVPGALLARKGGAWHRRWGIGFTVSMFVVLLSAGFLWQAKGHLFLVPLAGVSGYLIFNGWRVIARRRRRRPDQIEDRIDMLAAWAAIAAGAGTAYLGGTAATPLMLSIKPALLGIGSIAIAFGANDLLGFRAPRMPAGWKLAHLSAMLAAYISAVTAFLVINAHDVPMLVRWLVPSTLGGAAIVAYSLSVLVPGLRAARRARRVAAAARRPPARPARELPAPGVASATPSRRSGSLH
jgi:hypothetical protein